MTSLTLRSLWITTLFLVLMVNFLCFAGSIEMLSANLINSGDSRTYYFGFSSIYKYFMNNPMGTFIDNYNNFTMSIRDGIKNYDFAAIKSLANQNLNIVNLILGIASILLIGAKGVFLFILIGGYVCCAIIFVIVGLFDIVRYLAPLPTGLHTL